MHNLLLNVEHWNCDAHNKLKSIEINPFSHFQISNHYYSGNQLELPIVLMLEKLRHLVLTRSHAQSFQQIKVATFRKNHSSHIYKQLDPELFILN